MNKTLTLIRHAKSSWSTPGANDHDRILNERGLMDSPQMGKALSERGVHFDMILCSTARRAMQTLDLLCEYPLADKEAIHYLDELYCASTDKLISIIQQVDKQYNDIAIVAHNPGLEDLANKLISGRMNNMATCSVVQIGFDIEDWDQVNTHTGEQQLDINPKNL
ncbi:MAG: histidine phosphatase family protein [Gammaproteobacteria bacterium]|nr:histidine phosphatase family protein [Gammaproteobacteria bacterium]